jgi:hypothetical protein
MHLQIRPCRDRQKKEQQEQGKNLFHLSVPPSSPFPGSGKGYR